MFSKWKNSRDETLLRRGLHEVSREGKVSAQGVMGTISIFPSHRARPLLFRKLYVSYFIICKYLRRLCGGERSVIKQTCLFPNKSFVHILNYYICKIRHTNWISNTFLVRYCKWIYSRVTFQFKKVRKMQNLGNVYICGSPFVMSRTDAQSGLDMVFIDWEMSIAFLI
jgi:hypothetical protein